jgi:hypothetical protein
MEKKIYLYLCGGLGNQLFQYAAAKNIALKNNAKLILDTSTGFISDFRDFWNFSLNKNKLKNVKYKKIIFIFVLFKLFRKIFRTKKIFFKFFSNNLVDEMHLSRFSKKISDFKIKKNFYLFGYFQSEKYFNEYRNRIIRELLPSQVNNNIFLNIKNKIVKTNSVSIGVRLHETMPGNINYKIGGITSLNFYDKAIKKIIKHVKKPQFFIFSTKKENIEELFSKVKELEKYPTHIITKEEGYHGSAYDNLWLMSFCKNHIISNSTFYWWAAYFSKFRYKKQKIICSGNFPNKDTCFNEWKLEQGNIF